MHDHWETRTYVSGDKVDEGDGFSVGGTSTWVFMALLALSVWAAARPRAPDGRMGLGWLPLCCSAVMMVNGIDAALRLVRETEQFLVGAPVEVHAGQGMGPFVFVLCQAVAILGGLLLLRAAPPKHVAASS